MPCIGTPCIRADDILEPVPGCRMDGSGGSAEARHTNRSIFGLGGPASAGDKPKPPRLKIDCPLGPPEDCQFATSLTSKSKRGSQHRPKNQYFALFFPFAYLCSLAASR